MPGHLQGTAKTRLDEALPVLWMMRWDSSTKVGSSRREAFGKEVAEGRSRPTRSDVVTGAAEKFDQFSYYPPPRTFLKNLATKYIQKCSRGDIETCLIYKRPMVDLLMFSDETHVCGHVSRRNGNNMPPIHIGVEADAFILK